MISPERKDYPIVNLYKDTIPAPIIEEDSATGITYIGYAPLGTETSEAKWMIIRVTEVTAGTVTTTTTEYVRGVGMKYESVWDNRAALTYVR